jgi:hypothetical protein
MKHLLTIILCLAIVSAGFSQFSLVINNDAFIVLDGGITGAPIYLVVDETDARGITTLGSGGNIISEGEHNKIQWNIGTTVDSYIVPFTSNNGVGDKKIPFSIQTTGAAVGANGRLRLSTWETADGNLAATWPDDVTHINTAPTGLSDGLNIVDRFWKIDANNYTTQPDALLGFVYNDNNEIAGTNTINVGNENTLVAQSFDPINLAWRGNPTGTSVFYGSYTAPQTVSGAAVTNGDFYGSWTLALQSLLLPIELVEFQAECVNGYSNITWTTASETNNDHFILESSLNGTDFNGIATIAGAGNSVIQNEYEYTDFSTHPGTIYYRLAQVDYDGTTTYSDVVAVENCSGDLGEVNVFSNGAGTVNVNINSNAAAAFNVKIVDTRGRLILAPKELSVSEGTNTFNLNVKDVGFGIYYVIIENAFERSVSKLVLN